MFNKKSLQERIWYRSLFFLISAISSVLFIFSTLYTIDLKVNHSAYTSLFLTFSILLLLSAIGFPIIGFRIPIKN
jgi:hypothetical protein